MSKRGGKKPREKISDIKRTTTRKAQKAPSVVEQVPVPGISIQDLLFEFYGDKLTSEQRERIAIMKMIDPYSQTYLADLQEAASAVIEGGNDVLSILEKTDKLIEIYWTLPQMIPFDSVHTINAIAEFEEVGGTILTEPCSICGGFEYICREMSGRGDEITRTFKTCVKCKR